MASLTTDNQLGSLFFAFSDPLRRKVLEEVARHPNATVSEICGAFPVSRFAVMRHLNVLEEAGLIDREAVGRERRVRLSDHPFEHVIARWMDQLRQGGNNEDSA